MSNQEIYNKLKSEGLSDKEIAESYVFPIELTPDEKEQALKDFREFREKQNMIPQSWSPNFKLPDCTPEQEEDVILHLMECLFHMPDDEAEKIKYQFLLKYPFLDADRIKNW